MSQNRHPTPVDSLCLESEPNSRSKSCSTANRSQHKHYMSWEAGVCFSCSSLRRCLLLLNKEEEGKLGIASQQESSLQITCGLKEALITVKLGVKSGSMSGQNRSLGLCFWSQESGRRGTSHLLFVSTSQFALSSAMREQAKASTPCFSSFYPDRYFRGREKTMKMGAYSKSKSEQHGFWVKGKPPGPDILLPEREKSFQWVSARNECCSPKEKGVNGESFFIVQLFRQLTRNRNREKGPDFTPVQTVSKAKQIRFSSHFSILHNNWTSSQLIVVLLLLLFSCCNSHLTSLPVSQAVYSYHTSFFTYQITIIRVEVNLWTSRTRREKALTSKGAKERVR